MAYIIVLNSLIIGKVVDVVFVRRTGTVPVPVQLGNTSDSHLSGWPVLVFAFGLVLVIALWVRKVRGAILISIVITTILAYFVEKIGKIGPSFIPPDKV